MKSRVASKSPRAALLALPAFLFAAVWWARPFLYAAAERFPACQFRKITGWLCPACGNTHSVLALLRLDIPGALRASLIPPMLIVFAAAAYAELLFRAFGRPVKLLPRHPVFYWVLLAGCILYWLGRNIISF